MLILDEEQQTWIEAYDKQFNNTSLTTTKRSKQPRTFIQNIGEQAMMLNSSAIAEMRKSNMKYAAKS